MPKSEFVAKFGGVFEHSPWIAERACVHETAPVYKSAEDVHRLLVEVFRSAGAEERLGVLRAHPDLAGRIATAGHLTAASANEQASAGLDMLTDEERARFFELNEAYVARFGFPFILAVKGLSKDEIIANFIARLGNDCADEFNTACAQVERIAYLRLLDMFSA